MIAHELVLLGLLYERPRHGYEIKKKIKDILFLFAGLDATSIYYPLTILEKRGYVVKESERKGSRPRRFVYHLTSKGKVRFKQLLEKSFLDFKRPQFSLDLSLYFLHDMDPGSARRRLAARMHILDKLVRSMRQMRSTIGDPQTNPLGRILEHNLQMVDTESQFLGRLIACLPDRQALLTRKGGRVEENPSV